MSWILRMSSKGWEWRSSFSFSSSLQLSFSSWEAQPSQSRWEEYDLDSLSKVFSLNLARKAYELNMEKRRGDKLLFQVIFAAASKANNIFSDASTHCGPGTPAKEGCHSWDVWISHCKTFLCLYSALFSTCLVQRMLTLLYIAKNKKQKVTQKRFLLLKQNARFISLTLLSSAKSLPRARRWRCKTVFESNHVSFQIY